MEPEKKVEKIKPIIGQQIGWGLVGSKYNIKPYFLPEGATYVHKVRVREKIDVFGVGTDVIQMQGIFVVQVGHPIKANKEEKLGWTNALINVEFRSLELYGESSLFGTVRVRLNDKHPSIGRVGPGTKGSRAGACRIDVFPVVELPDLGMTLNTQDTPMRLASKVIQIPPVGDVARSEASRMLSDEHDQSVGELISADIEVGELIHAHPLGTMSEDPRFDREFNVKTFGI